MQPQAQRSSSGLQGPIFEPRSEELSRRHSQPRRQGGPEAPHGKPGCGQGQGRQECPQGGQSRMMSNSLALGPGGGGPALRPCTPACQGCWRIRTKGVAQRPSGDGSSASVCSDSRTTYGRKVIAGCALRWADFTACKLHLNKAGRNQGAEETAVPALWEPGNTLQKVSAWRPGGRASGEWPWASCP